MCTSVGRAVSSKEYIMVAASQPGRSQSDPEFAVRGGIYTTLAAADQVVAQLLSAGFSKEDITVVCSDEARERHFREFEHQDPAGDHTEGATVAGSSIGA